MKAKLGQNYTLILDDFVPGGQTIGTLPHGQKVFVWGGLPGEEVIIRISKVKRTYAEGVVEEVTHASANRVEPIDPAFLSTSPWQVLVWEKENPLKQDLLEASFAQFGLELPWEEFYGAGSQHHYRNKMEFSFWWDHEEGVRLAFHQRGSRQKLPVQGSVLAMPVINDVAGAIVEALNQMGVEAFQLKTLLLRANQDGRVSAGLFVKDEKFSESKKLAERLIESHGALQGIGVYYSNHRSPVSVIDETLASVGELTLGDELLGKQYAYDALSFFQVNLEPYTRALEDIASQVEGDKNIVDYFSGVGTIGLTVGANALIELDASSATFARQNAQRQGAKADVIHAASEQTLSYLQSDQTVITDPPRAGMHKKFTQALTEVKPEKIIYLSCNPATQARDVTALANDYNVRFAHGFNFFPRTPHIESLLVLERR